MILRTSASGSDEEMSHFSPINVHIGVSKYQDGDAIRWKKEVGQRLQLFLLSNIEYPAKKSGLILNLIFGIGLSRTGGTTTGYSSTIS